jgi:hypothetical protein
MGTKEMVEQTPIQNVILKALRDDRIRMEEHGELYYARDIETNGFMIYRNGDRMTGGDIQTNVPHVCIHHSPTGFEFGYHGSGPADLALNILEVYLQLSGHEGERIPVYEGDCFALAYVLHQDFKQEFVAEIPDTGATIHFVIVEKWVNFQMTTDRVIERMQQWSVAGHEL